MHLQTLFPEYRRECPLYHWCRKSQPWNLDEIQEQTQMAPLKEKPEKVQNLNVLRKRRVDKFLSIHLHHWENSHNHIALVHHAMSRASNYHCFSKATSSGMRLGDPLRDCWVEEIWKTAEDIPQMQRIFLPSDYMQNLTPFPEIMPTEVESLALLWFHQRSRSHLLVFSIAWLNSPFCPAQGKVALYQTQQMYRF